MDNIPTSTPPNVPELTQLHDIHIPTPVDWWPLAPGWYLLALIVIFTGLCLIYLAYRHYSGGHARRQALQALANYETQHRQHPNSQRSSAAVSELLKRVALAYYPREQVAGLQGEVWLDFLNRTATSRRTDAVKQNDDRTINFDRVRNELLEYPYQPPQPCDLEPLFHLARTWIKCQRQVRHVCSN